MIQFFFCQKNNAETDEDYSVTLTSSETQVLFSSMKSSETKETKEQQERRKSKRKGEEKENVKERRKTRR